MRKLIKAVLDLQKEYGDIAIIVKPSKLQPDGVASVSVEAMWFDADKEQQGIGFIADPKTSMSVKQLRKNIQEFINTQMEDA